jgi:hypothetical protein
VLLDRISARTRNDYGKSPEERELILTHLREVEPLLRRSLPLADVAQRVIRIGSGS